MLKAGEYLLVGDYFRITCDELYIFLLTGICHASRD